MPLMAAGRLAWPGFVLDLGAGELFDANGRPTELRAQALKLLLLLGERAGQVVSKDDLMHRVWGEVIVTEDSLVQAVGDIRRVLGDARHERVRTVPRRGYMLCVEPADAGAPVALPGRLVPAQPAAPVAGAARAGGPLWHRSSGALALVLAVLTAVVVAVVIAGGAMQWGTQRDAAKAAAPRSLAILPFEGDEGTAPWFVDGVGSDLEAVLVGWTDLTVIGRGTMTAYKGRTVDPRVVGTELGVRHVLTGRARRDGEHVRLTVTLVDARTGEVEWSMLRDVPRSELPALVGDVAGGLARALTVAYGDAVKRDVRALAPHQAQADDLALHGHAELLRTVSREGWERARGLFEAALALDPDCVRCLGGLSLTLSNLVLWEWTPDRAATLAAAEQASARLDRIAPNRSLALLARASLAHTRRDWKAVLSIGDQLAEHFPNDPAAHHHRCSALLRLGRFEDSIAACARAQRISPRDSRVATWQGLIGYNEFMRGRWSEAEQALRRSVLGNPRVPFYGVVLAAALAEQDRRDEAATAIAEVRTRHPEYRAGAIGRFWIADDAGFQRGRDRVVSRALELGLPP
ncbi:MAG: winged helix-turn-helix domain-containing protein [Rubrivivax sp.]|nr:winged helix-turn-helix domain-containing protein [Rubrivivax sp.]